MKETMPFEITIQHKNPVSMDVIVDAVSLLSEAAARTSHGIIEELGRRFKTDSSVLTLIHARIDQLQADAFWLERVEAGSSIFKGEHIVLAVQALTAVINLATAFHPALPTRELDELRKAVVKMDADLHGGLQAHCTMIQDGRREADRSAVEIDIDNECLKVIVKPAAAKSNIKLVVAQAVHAAARP